MSVTIDRDLVLAQHRSAVCRSDSDLDVELGRERLLEHDAVRALVVDVEHQRLSAWGRGQHAIGVAISASHHHTAFGADDIARMDGLRHVDARMLTSVAVADLEDAAVANDDVARAASRGPCRHPGAFVVKNGSNTRSRARAAHRPAVGHLDRDPPTVGVGARPRSSRPYPRRGRILDQVRQHLDHQRRRAHHRTVRDLDSTSTPSSARSASETARRTSFARADRAQLELVDAVRKLSSCRDRKHDLIGAAGHHLEQLAGAGLRASARAATSRAAARRALTIPFAGLRSSCARPGGQHTERGDSCSARCSRSASSRMRNWAATRALSSTGSNGLVT